MDLAIQRFIDVMLSFPIIVMALIVVAIVPRSDLFGVDVNVIIAIAIPFIPKVARVIRSAALSIVTMPYIDATRAAGYSRARIMFRHIMPNVLAPYLIMLTALWARQSCWRHRSASSGWGCRSRLRHGA